MADTTIPLSRQCTKCKQDYPATTEFFVRQKEKKSGLSSHCRDCIRIRNRIANRRNRESVAFRELECERAKQYRLANPEKMRERSRNYESKPENKQKRRRYRETYNKKPEVMLRHREYQREYRKTEKGQRYSKLYMVQYVAANKHTDHWKQMKRAERLRRSTRLAEAEGTHTAEDILLQFKAQKGLCWWCGKELLDEYETDHVIPLARGGSNAAENIVVACPHCNRSKGTKLPHEWNGRLL